MLTQQEELSGLIKVLKYYAFFRYAAPFDDIYVAYPYAISKNQLDSILKTAVTEGRILTEKIDGTSYYTLPSHGISLHEVSRKIETTKQKLDKVYPFLFFAKYIPSVYLIGLSGSLAMQNAGKNDDVDFFVISAPGRIWTTRFLLLLLASVLGMRRKRGERSPSGKVCLNLFFDGSDLQIPQNKRNLYVAHEIVHMKLLFVRDNMDSRFLEANSWIYAFLPNTDKSYRTNRTYKTDRTYLTEMLESLFKELQLYFIRKHQTSELVSTTQMWFYPDDFEEKMRKKNMI